MSKQRPNQDKAYARPTARSRELRANATDVERCLWHNLSARKVAGTRFNRQVPIGPYICDFVARTAKLVVEVDGGQHADQVEADARRTAHLESQGYRVIRFWNNDVLANTEGVVRAIEEALHQAPLPLAGGAGGGLVESTPHSTHQPSPNPSRKREGNW